MEGGEVVGLELVTCDGSLFVDRRAADEFEAGEDDGGGVDVSDGISMR